MLTPDDIYGWFLEEEGHWYNSECEKIHSGIVVEVGVFLGKSVSWIVDTCKRNGNKIFAVDPWEKIEEFWSGPGYDPVGVASIPIPENWFEQFEQNMRAIDAFPTVVPVRKLSTVAAKEFEDNSIDLLFLDGCHNYSAVLQDIVAWSPKMKTSGSIISGHDASWIGVSEAVREVLGIG